MAPIILTTLLIGSTAISVNSTQEQLWITDSAGPLTYIYDVPTWELIDSIPIGDHVKGLCATADGATVFLSLESSNEVIRIDATTRKVTGRVDVGRKPHEIECTPDGRFVYVPCANKHWWIIDGQTMEVIQRLPVEGRPHNTLITPDHQWMILAPQAPASALTIVDLSDHSPTAKIEFSDATRPGDISADGKRVFHNVDGLIGFEVASLESRELTDRVEHQIADDKQEIKSRCHGLAIRPDQKEVWSANVMHQSVHIHELESGEFRETASLPCPGWPYWITFSQDGRFAFVSIKPDGSITSKMKIAAVALSAIGFASLLTLPFWLRGRKQGLAKQSGKRARGILICGSLCLLAACGLYAGVKSIKGRILVFDANSKSVVAELEAGHRPLHTQTILVSPSPQESSD